MRKIHDLVGKRFGKFIVLKEADNRGKNTAWLCKCDCGNTRNVLTYNLLGGKSTNCGCVRKEKISALMKTHGESKTRLYRLYLGIKQRCNNSNSPAYRYYGGKGVTLCNEWDDDFMKFKEWSYSHSYNEFMSIDRIDPNGNYCPENCRWVNMQKQQNNKLNSVFVTIGQEKLTVAEWADKNKTNKQTLYSKFYRLLKQLGIENENVEGFHIILKSEERPNLFYGGDAP